MNTPLIKPLLRGHFHQAAFFFALGACCMLIADSPNSQSLIANIVYSLSLCGLFGVSALYHRPTWSPRFRVWMRRLDHAAIFVLIAGTSTPIFTSKNLLISIWIAASLGVVQSLVWVKAPKWLSAILYVGVGWIAVPHLAEIESVLGPTNLVLILVGGVIYSLGALVYALKKPNPWPRVFGYHEIFHLMVIVAAVLHFIVIAKLNFKGSL